MGPGGQQEAEATIPPDYLRQQVSRWHRLVLPRTASQYRGSHMDEIIVLLVSLWSLDN